MKDLNCTVTSTWIDAYDLGKIAVLRSTNYFLTTDIPEEAEGTPEEQHATRKSKESCTIITASGSTTTTEEANVCVRDLHMVITIQLFEHSVAVLSSGQLCKGNGTSLQVGNLCSDSRT